MPNFDQAFPLVLPITNTGWVKVCLVGLPGGPYILFAIDVQLFWEDFDPSPNPSALHGVFLATTRATPKVSPAKVDAQLQRSGNGSENLSVQNVWIICGSKAFHVSLQNLERCTSEDELVTAHERNV